MRYIAFLRAINVGGRFVKMETLRGHFETLGFTRVESFISSGNIIFESDAQPTAIAKKVEAHLLDALGVEVATLVRTPGELTHIANFRPFESCQIDTAGAFCVGFLERELDSARQNDLVSLRTDIDDFHIAGRELYWLCQNRQSESTFSNARFERLLGVRATFRGINTLQKLAAKYPASSPRK